MQHSLNKENMCSGEVKSAVVTVQGKKSAAIGDRMFGFAALASLGPF